ncbi:MAG: nucleotidyltransferase domain-containing protein [Campylobacterales bacterium]|nr:nucleotidyltransferase domain-containing protein [Campylobacterales bacterium]
MRLTNRLRNIIKEAYSYSFGTSGDIYLFGSRTDDTKKGGDIDLAIKTNINHKLFKKQKIKFKTYLFRKGYDLKIDLIQFNSTIDKLLFQEISTTGIKI